MKRMQWIVRIFLVLILGGVSLPQLTHAGVELTEKKQLDLDVQPLDIAPLANGELISILARGEVLIYSISADKITERISVDKVFDQLTYSPKTKEILLTSSTSKGLKIIQVDFIQNIDITGLPFKGPRNAPVTIAVFSDYQ